MPKIVKSARGQNVDFDLLKIKQQIASVPKTTNVKAREDFIDQKFKRRLKKLKRDVVSSVVPTVIKKPVVTPESEPEPVVIEDMTPENIEDFEGTPEPESDEE